MDDCSCFSHEVARAWSVVTGGESYICFAVAVTSAKGAGAYLGKYMGKDMFEKKGRRYSKSNGWPSEKRRRLKPGAGGFKRALWTPGRAPEDLRLKWDDIPRTGTELQVEEARKAAIKRFVKLGEDNVNNA